MFYRMGRLFFKALFLLFFRIRITGGENLPPSGPVIVFANHISWWDPPLVGAAMRRQVFFMAKEELFKIPLVGYLLKRVGAFPVRRGEADRAAIRSALSHLAAGRAIGLFPEGTRSKDGKLKRAHPGMALIAVKSGAPLLPVSIKGPYRFRRLVEVKVGRPFNLGDPELRARGPVLETLSKAMMNRLAALLGDPASGTETSGTGRHRRRGLHHGGGSRENRRRP